MTLVKFDVTEDFADSLKSATGANVSSKAAYAACLAYFDQLDMIARLERENGLLRQRAQLAEQTISRARDSASSLLAYVAQPDLLDSPH